MDHTHKFFTQCNNIILIDLCIYRLNTSMPR